MLIVILIRYWFLKHLLYASIFLQFFSNWNSCLAYVDCHNVLSRECMPYYVALHLLVALMIISLFKVPWRAWKQPRHRPHWNSRSLYQVKGLLGIVSEGLSCKNANAYLSLLKGIMLAYVLLSKAWYESFVGSHVCINLVLSIGHCDELFRLFHPLILS